VLVNNAGVMGLPLTHTADGFERIATEWIGAIRGRGQTLFSRRETVAVRGLLDQVRAQIAIQARRARPYR